MVLFLYTIMLPSNAFLASLLPLVISPATLAEIIPLTGRSITYANHYRRQARVFGNGSVALFNQENLQYSCNLTIGGREYGVIVDTGRYAVTVILRLLNISILMHVPSCSSDLWVMESVAFSGSCLVSS